MRIQRAGRPGGRPVPPPELAERCAVVDWVSPEELAVLEAGGPAVRWERGPRSWVMDALLLAHRRHRAARRAWLDEHAVPRDLAAEVIPLRRPTWRGPARVAS